MLGLKECPFCLSELVGISIGPQTEITMFRCFDCGATVSFRGSEEFHNAIKAWNNRTVKPDHKKLFAVFCIDTPIQD